MSHTILVPVDGSPFSEQALRAAAELAQAQGGEIVILSVLLEFVSTAPHIPKLDRAAELHVQEYVNGLEQEVRTSAVVVSHQVRWGQPAPVIVATARDVGADLIVMASHGIGAAGPGLPTSGLGG